MRIPGIFADAKNKKAVLVPYITAGYPQKTATLELLCTMSDAGAEIIEIGLPFSDPMADGPVIEKAGHQALKNGVDVAWIFDTVAEFRKVQDKTAIVLMGYYNTVDSYGVEKFTEEANKCGVDGILIVDAPYEEAVDLQQACIANNLSMINLIAPTTSDSRIKNIAKFSGGYLYIVSLKGVTGSELSKIHHVEQLVNKVREHSDLPIVVGFGIRDQETAKSIALFADGVVIGSRVIELVTEDSQNQTGKFESHNLSNFLSDICKSLQK